MLRGAITGRGEIHRQLISAAINTLSQREEPYGCLLWFHSDNDNLVPCRPHRLVHCVGVFGAGGHHECDNAGDLHFGGDEDAGVSLSIPALKHNEQIVPPDYPAAHGVFGLTSQGEEAWPARTAQERQWPVA
jgi:hypothetical protein